MSPYLMMCIAALQEAYAIAVVWVYYGPMAALVLLAEILAEV